MLESLDLKTTSDILLAENGFIDDQKPAWATFIKNLAGYDKYHSHLVFRIRQHFGDRITVYRPMSRREYEAIFILDAARPITVTLREEDAKKETEQRNVLCFHMEVDPSAIIMRGRAANDELVIDSSLVLKSRIAVTLTANLQ